ncbi:TetR/AcrR family transcriptional regulator [Streptomyces sp. NPDC016675]|uniref:TetR/AcrR family transcriptional regulator n=1 Tax=Streptomyces sp. NPDC016675 TaxID=3364970 RepID=UPI0036FF10CC
MASTTRRPSKASDRRALLEERILTVIEELLQGGVTYTELSVEQIAQAAGISRSTFYLYFRDKVDVLLRLSVCLRSESYAIAAAWRPTGAEGGLAGLTRTYELIMRHYRKYAALLAAIGEVAAYDPAVREAWGVYQRQFIENTIAVLKEEQAAGRTSAVIDPELAAKVIVQGGGQVIARQVADGDGAHDLDVARELATGYWYGVYRRPVGSIPGPAHDEQQGSPDSDA